MESLRTVYAKIGIQSQRNANHVCKHMKAIIYSDIHGLIIDQPRSESQPTTYISGENRIPKQHSSFNRDEYSW